MITKATFKITNTLILFTSLSFAVFAQQKKPIPSNQYVLDIKQSKIFWKGPKSAGNKHHGYLQLRSGVLNETNKGKFNTADFTINMNSITTQDYKKEKDNQEVDAVLKGHSFFMVADYPTGRMTVKQIEIMPERNQYTVYGDLTLKGISRPIVFVATIKKNANTVLATASFNIDRNKWGINAKKSDDMMSFMKDQLIADDIPIALDLIFNKL